MLTAGVLAALVSPTALAAAQTEDAADFVLEQVVVTAQRQETKELDTPASVTVITAQDIKNTGAKTVFDALSFMPGIVNLSYGPGGLDYGAMDSRVNIRGFERGALILVNGAPVNLNGKNSLDGIMTDNVERIEIVRGAASVLYGAEAMGGVVNIITKKGGPARLDLTAAAGNLGYDRESFAYQNDGVSVLYTKQHFGAQARTSPDRPDRGYYNNRGKGSKDNYAFSARLSDEWSFSYMRSKTDSMYGQVNYLKPSSSSDYRYNDVKDTANLIYHNQEQRLKAVLFYSSRDLYGSTYSYGKPAQGFVANGSNYKARNYGLDLQKGWRLRDGEDGLIVGALISGEEYQGASAANRNVDPSRRNYALYAQYTQAMSPDFTAIFGLRGQMVDDPVKDQQVFMPQLQTVYKIDETSSWYTNIGKAFQMPSLSDSYKTVSGHYAPVSGRNLKPQEGWNYETGYKIINDHNSWKFAVYHMNFKNAFAWAKDEDGQDIRINKGQFRNTGLEIEHMTVLNPRTKANFSVSWSNPENKASDGGRWTQAYPKLQLTAGVRYAKDKWSLGLACNWLTDRLQNRDGGVNPDLINVNVMAAYKATKDDQFVLNVNNVLNRDNVITNGDWEYYDLPRNWTLSYQRTF